MAAADPPADSASPQGGQPAPHADARKTYRLDLARAPFSGLMQEGIITFGLLIAIRVYDAPSTVKSILSAAFAAGLLFTPVVLSLVARTGLKVSTLCFIYGALSGLAYLAAGLAPTLELYTLCILAAGFMIAQQAPLVTQIYATNYASRERGRRVAHYFMILAISGGVLSIFGGRILDLNLNRYSLIFLALGLSGFISGFLMGRMPSAPVESGSGGSLWQNLSLFRRDGLFGWMLSAWMFMGVGNLMTIPLRVEYLANPDFNINLTNTQIATITVFVPAATRLLTTPVWGFLFDRINFIILRVALNLCFMSGIFLFFMAETPLVLSIGTALFGAGAAGGNLVWILWVTKLAPPGQTSAYMSVHTGLTGVRGVAAPFIGYFFLGLLGPFKVGMLAGGMVMVSILMFLAVRRHPRFR
ncbi:MAG: MFS transporter [Opitutales bacterium]